MRGRARARDKAGRTGRFFIMHKLRQFFRRAMRRRNRYTMFDTEFFQDVDSALHNFPIGVAAHNYRYSHKSSLFA